MRTLGLRNCVLRACGVFTRDLAPHGGVALVGGYRKHGKPEWARRERTPKTSPCDSGARSTQARIPTPSPAATRIQPISGYQISGSRFPESTAAILSFRASVLFAGLAIKPRLLSPLLFVPHSAGPLISFPSCSPPTPDHRRQQWFTIIPHTLLPTSSTKIMPRHLTLKSSVAVSDPQSSLYEPISPVSSAPSHWQGY